MSSERSHLLITDLDNTLYDWVSSFVPALLAMVDVGAQVLGVSAEQLLSELREVHQRHGNSEHPFALLETKSAEARFGKISPSDLPEGINEALHAFNKVRKSSLRLYDGVIETLRALSERGIPVVAFTDARIPNSLFRLERLSIAPLIARLYAPRPRYDLPPLGQQVTSVDADFVRVLPSEDRKPNPKTLLDICNDYNVSPSQAVYVGDSLTRDVYMARQAGVKSAWARYGTEYDKALWQHLTQVTHWTEHDVQAEVELRNRARGVRADVELSSFDGLLTHFDFYKASLR